MADREKIIEEAETCCKSDGWTHCGDCEYKQGKAILTCRTLFESMLELLKEQEKQKFFVDENGKITPLPVVVRCKDCKFVCMCDTTAIMPLPVYAICTLTDKVHEPDWFCADGERKE